MIVLFYKSSCRVPPNFTSYEAQSETNLAFPYLCALEPNHSKKQQQIYFLKFSGNADLDGGFSLSLSETPC